MANPVDPRSDRISVMALRGMKEVKEGDDIGEMIVDACRRSGIGIEDGDVVVVAHKIVSKAEGRMVKLSEVRPGPFAKNLAEKLGKAPEEVEVILSESRGIVKMGHGVLICETKHGFVCANAGVDRSNVPEGYALLLPKNPDASAERIRRRIKALTGKDVAVIISDTFGRPWREGHVDFAIGLSGISCFRDYRGTKDMRGRELKVTIIAHVDELAAAAELVMGKAKGAPAAIIRGYDYEKDESGRAKDIVREESRDLFR